MKCFNQMKTVEEEFHSKKKKILHALNLTENTENSPMSIAQILFVLHSCVRTNVKWLQLPVFGAC